MSLGIFKRIISGITSIFKGSGSGSPAKGGKEGSPEKSSSERKPRRDRQRGKSAVHFLKPMSSRAALSISLASGKSWKYFAPSSRFSTSGGSQEPSFFFDRMLWARSSPRRDSSGGMDYERQRRLLQAGCDLIVATPGRLIDFLQKRVIDTSMLKVLIIDEADRMLDMGFIPDVKRIIAHLPSKEERQTMLFSATLSRDIMNLASRWMRPDPTVLEVEPEHVVAEGVNETVYACTTHEKLAIIIWILQHEDVHRALIFRNRRRDVEELCHQLRRYGIQCEMLSGDVSQNRRLNILEAFRNGTVKVVVATDVAGRGIQVDDITHVFNYDLPYEAEDYVHRVGRTARAGHQGRAVSFADEDCAFVMPEIEEYIGRPLAAIQPPEEMLVLPSAPSEPKAHSHRGDSGRHFPSGGRSASRPASGSRSSHGGRPSSRSGSSFHRTGSGVR